MAKIIYMSNGGAKMILLIAVAILAIGAAGIFLIKGRSSLSTSSSPSGSESINQTLPSSGSTQTQVSGKAGSAASSDIDSELNSLDSDAAALDGSFNDKAFDAMGQ